MTHDNTNTNPPTPTAFDEALDRLDVALNTPISKREPGELIAAVDALAVVTPVHPSVTTAAEMAAVIAASTEVAYAVAAYTGTELPPELLDELASLNAAAELAELAEVRNLDTGEPVEVVELRRGMPTPVRTDTELIPECELADLDEVVAIHSTIDDIEVAPIIFTARQIGHTWTGGPDLGRIFEVRRAGPFDELPAEYVVASATVDEDGDHRQLDAADRPANPFLDAFKALPLDDYDGVVGAHLRHLDQVVETEATIREPAARFNLVLDALDRVWIAVGDSHLDGFAILRIGTGAIDRVAELFARVNLDKATAGVDAGVIEVTVLTAPHLREPVAIRCTYTDCEGVQW